MQTANVNCTGIEMSLGRCIHADGFRVDKKQTESKLHEITIIKQERKYI